MADSKPRNRRKGKGTVSRVNKLTRQVALLSSCIEELKQQMESQQKRLDDLEYFRENAKELLDIQEIQDS